MESLNGTAWDVVISGTGLPQSLLALALSRSGKKVLHVDRQEWYGGDEAVLSLADAEAWAEHNAGADDTSVFSFATVTQPEGPGSADTTLAHSRKYALALAPHLLYSRSSLLSALVSSQTHTQLDFQAIASWFIAESPLEGSPAARPGLTRVPGSREDVFQDGTLDLRAKKSLMKFLRSVSQFDRQGDAVTPDGSAAFPDYLEQEFGLPRFIHTPLLALTMSRASPRDTTVDDATPRIARHLSSIGVFGPGFPAVLPKWGGLAEIAQVACRASAVGGGVYVLGRAVVEVQNAEDEALDVQLAEGDRVSTKWLVGTTLELPNHSQTPNTNVDEGSCLSRSISIVSSPLTSLFSPTSEGGVIPAGAVVLVPGPSDNEPPVYLFIHSSESGECPAGQSVVYASIALNMEAGLPRLESAVTTLLDCVGEQSPPSLLWSMQYQQRFPSSTSASHQVSESDRVITLRSVPADLALEDSVLDDVKSVWQRIAPSDGGSFMTFDSRENTLEEDGLSN